MRKVLWIALFVTSQLCASLPVHYVIRSIDGNRMTLSDNAVFLIDSQDVITLQHWSGNESVELLFPVEALFIAPSVEIMQGRIAQLPAFSFLHQNGRTVKGWLQQAPPSVQAGILSIAAIDLNHQTVILNDSTTWNYFDRDAVAIGLWQVGDLVMIGSYDLFPPSVYDAILFNTTRQSLVQAAELFQGHH